MAFLIIAQAFRVVVVEGEEWREVGAKFARIDTIEGERGNIYSENGHLLATSLPFFDIYVDMTVPSDSIFKYGVDSLAACLEKYFQDVSKADYRLKLEEARAKKRRYVLIQKGVDYSDLPIVKSWPILRHGRHRGGLILELDNRRVNPFGFLARRTIGYSRTKSQVGLEGNFDSYLRGSKAPQSQQLIGGIWQPLFDVTDIEVDNGNDLYTTINVNMQDIVEKALYKGVRKHWAKYGCAIVMEVATGQIKAIANLQMGQDSSFYETYNHAVGTKSEHGSTIKIAALTALLEDGFVDDSTMVDIEYGKKLYHDKWMHDSAWHPENNITVSRVIEISSNVGISKLTDRYYGDKPQDFLTHLDKMGLTQPTGIEIRGEGLPVIKSHDSKDWTGVSLTQMSIGYELEFTPLQVLNFFNAIANDGKMMKPYLVTDIKKDNQVLKHHKPEVLIEEMCKKSTAKTVQKMLVNVVEGKYGRAKALKSDKVSMGCKTGTARIARNDKGYEERRHQASIVGFFPAEKPIYSCIVVVFQPSMGDIYGGTVAGPILKEIVEKLYANSIDIQVAINKKEQKPTIKMPVANHGFQEDITTIYEKMNVSNLPMADAQWVVPKRHENAILLQELKVIDHLIPNVTGMGLRDALYILENHGLRVRFKGHGKVGSQSPTYGTPFEKGTIITLELN